MSQLIRRGEIWLADLNPTQGSEQAGIRPIITFQNDLVSQYSSTIITIPLTTNQRRASLPICLAIPRGEGGLTQESVALCFQLRVLDKTRLIKQLGQLSPSTIAQLEDIVLLTLVFCQEFFDGLKTLKTHTLKTSQIWFTHQLKVDRLLGYR